MTQDPVDGRRTAVAAAIIVDGCRVLMVRRRVAEGQLSWQFPAGKLNRGEQPEEAAVRETREETGIDAAASRLLGSGIHPMTGRLMHYVACRPIAGTARRAAPDEVAEVAWCTYAEVGARVPYGLSEAVRNYLDEALTP
jgi:8-oxo-dGTP diphosphatase